MASGTWKMKSGGDGKKVLGIELPTSGVPSAPSSSTISGNAWESWDRAGDEIQTQLQQEIRELEEPGESERPSQVNITVEQVQAPPKNSTPPKSAEKAAHINGAWQAAGAVIAVALGYLLARLLGH
jgi:hypothetical protein